MKQNQIIFIVTCLAMEVASQKLELFTNIVYINSTAVL